MGKRRPPGDSQGKWQSFRSLATVMLVLVGVVILLLGWLVPLWKGYDVIRSEGGDQGPIIDDESLPNPLYMRSRRVEIFDGPDGKMVGYLGRTVVYPTGRDGSWIRAAGYHWIWNANVTVDIGDATVLTETADLHYTANGLEVGQIRRGTQFQKLYVNKKESWAFAQLDIWVKALDVTPDESNAWDGNFLNQEYPLFTIVTREAGDVTATAARKTVTESGLSLVLFVGTIVFFGLVFIIKARMVRRSVTNNSITISGVTSSSINVQSPLATALVSIDQGGDSATAVALLQLADLVATATLDDEEKRDLRDLVEAVAEEARRPEPRRANLRALGSQLALGIAGSAIADQAAPLIEVVAKLWQ